MKTWLLFDCNYLCYRAFFKLKGLSHEGKSTGVLFGFLRDILYQQELHNTERIVFCFDHGKPLRCIEYPGYKASRKEKKLTDEEKAALLDMSIQVGLLRTKYLRQIGFKNICFEEGYEADDVIASIALNLEKNEEAIILSGDSDLYQLLSPRVMIYNLRDKKMVTADSFSEEYGVTPTQWCDVKALAGCKTDDIIGIKGVGEKTAAKFINGSLRSDSAAFSLIVKNNKLWKSNLPLVSLPYHGTPLFKLRKDKVTKEGWSAIADKLGMRSIRDGIIGEPKSGKKKGFIKEEKKQGRKRSKL